MNTNRITKIMISALVLAAVLTACAPATSTAAPGASEPTCLGDSSKMVADLQCRKITIAVENAYLPFNYIEIQNNKPGGWDYETWNEICTRLNCTPVFQETTWDSLIQSVANGQIDVGADGITKSADREKQVDFSTGYAQIQQRLMVRKGETRFSSIEEFAADPSLVLGTQVNTTNYNTAKKYLPEDRIQGFEQMPFAVQALLSGDVDAVVIDVVAGLGYQGINADQLDFVGSTLSSDELAFIFPKGSDLLAPVDLALKAMTDDGTLAALNQKYFSSDFKITQEDVK